MLCSKNDGVAGKLHGLTPALIRTTTTPNVRQRNFVFGLAFVVRQHRLDAFFVPP
jgi:hypothetical protein